MALLKFPTKEVFIRLEGDSAFLSTVKYGWFHWKTKEFPVVWDALSVTLQESPVRQARYLVPPVTVPLNKRGGV